MWAAAKPKWSSTLYVEYFSVFTGIKSCEQLLQDGNAFEDLSVAVCSEALRIQTAEYIQLWEFRASGHEVVVCTEELYLLWTWVIWPTNLTDKSYGEKARWRNDFNLLPVKNFSFSLLTLSENRVPAIGVGGCSTEKLSLRHIQPGSSLCLCWLRALSSGPQEILEPVKSCTQCCSQE